MMTTLLVALAQSAVIAASAGGPPQPAPTVWPIEWMKERCPHFTDTAVPLVTSDIAECQVTEWGEFASFERGTYYYVLYCVVLNENKEEDGACADHSSVSARVHGAANAAVFVREDNSPTVRLVMSHYTGPFGAIFEKPLLVSNAYGAIMQLTMHVPSTCYCNSSGYYIWRKTLASGNSLIGGGGSKVSIGGCRLVLKARTASGRILQRCRRQVVSGIRTTRIAARAAAQWTSNWESPATGSS
jgi:hypothetical protein